MPTPKTIVQYIKYLEKAKQNPKALNYLDADGKWQHLTMKEVLHQVRCVAAALKKLGLKKGDRVAIFSPVSHFWSICDLGIMYAGCVTVSIFPNISVDHFVYELQHSEPKLIFVADGYCHQLCNENLNLVKHIVSLDNRKFYLHEELFGDFLAKGESALKEYNNDVADRVQAPDDLASIVYTSGTTTMPKGVELTHNNLLCQADCAIDIFSWTPKDRYLSFLPLAHIFGRLVTIILMYAGSAIYCIREPMQLMKACHDVKPTILIFVPRLIEKIYQSILQKLRSSHGLKRILGTWAFNLANRSQKSLWTRTAHSVAEMILYSKIRKLLGGEVRMIIAGSAKCNPRQLKFFKAIGLPIYEGYGLTEGTPLTCNRPKDTVIGTVGKPMCDIEIRIASDGEILVRGPVILKGYYNDPNFTAVKLDQDGWFHTEDLGVMDSEGRLTIKGRLNEHCKLSNGEYVDMVEIEQRLAHLPFVDFSLVLAADRPFVTCLLFPNIEEIERYKRQSGLSGLTNEEFLAREFVKKGIEQELEQINRHLDKWERIRDYRFIPHQATVEGGELSPTLKTRRQLIETKYQRLIASMYPDRILQIEL